MMHNIHKRYLPRQNFIVSEKLYYIENNNKKQALMDDKLTIPWVCFKISLIISLKSLALND